jgi:hypothetical protein
MPVSSSTSTPGPDDSATIEAMAAAGPVNETWFHGSARCTFATISKANA